MHAPDRIRALDPYAKQVLENVGVKENRLIDLYLPGIRGAQGLGKSVEETTKFVADHYQNRNST